MLYVARLAENSLMKKVVPPLSSVIGVLVSESPKPNPSFQKK